MRPVRRVLGTVGLVVVVACATFPAAPASAQQDSDVTLRLLRQSPWSLAQRRSTLAFDVLATNAGAEPLHDLELSVQFGPHLATQTDFEEMLEGTPTEPIAAAQKDVPGSIDAGADRDLTMTIDLATIAALDPTDSQTYPATIRLLSSGTVTAALVTPVIYLAQEPAAPVVSSTWIDLRAPVAFDPSGALADPSFPAELARGGDLRAPVGALASATGGRRARGVFDLILDPLVVTQARQVSAGYRTADGTDVPPTDPAPRQATRFLSALSEVAADASIETVAGPYGSALAPAMLSSGLEAEFEEERAAGWTVVSGIGGSPVANVVRPVDGALSDDAVDWLANRGATVLLANADTVDRSVVQTALAPAPTVPMTTLSGATTTMVLPDPSVQALFERSDLLADPVLASQMVLGQLALIWKQQPVPSPPTVRGIAVAPPPTLPPAMWAPLLQRLGEAPFLSPGTASDLVANAAPSPDLANPALPLARPSTAAFDTSFAGEIRTQSSNADAYGSMVSNPDDATNVRRQLFLATTPGATIDPAVGQPWLDAVAQTTQRAFDVVTPSVSGSFTFTARDGTIPLAMGDPGTTPLRVTIELQSSSFTFPTGSSRTDTVQAPGEVWTFDVRATSSGKGAIVIRTLAPNGRDIAPPITVTAQSTAVNGVALLITGLAAFGLLLLYVRRWWRRRTNPGSTETT
jgi:hypothetical protein